MSEKLETHIQKMALGAAVELIEVDLTRFGEGILRWVVGDENDSAHTVTFDGQTYTPFPVKMEGFEVTATGPLPRPSIAVPDIEGLLSSIVYANGNLIGAPVRRIQTFDKFLDDGDDPDPDATRPIENYLLAKKTRHKPGEVIQWEMQAAIDVEGVMIPARQLMRDFCDHVYRVWDPLAGAFNYTGVTCPYTSPTSFDAEDNATTSANDVCGKRLGSCKKRFGANAELPFRGCPAMSRIRVR